MHFYVCKDRCDGLCNGEKKNGFWSQTFDPIPNSITWYVNFGK